MTERAQLLALADRVEAATGPDRELDAHIHCVREGLEFVCLGTGKEAYGSICDPSDTGYGTANTTTPGMLYARYPDHKNQPTLGGGKRGNAVQGCTPPRYTASLDAAMTLVPEGYLYGIGNPSGGPHAVVCRTEDEPVEPVKGATAALAVTAAVLRALASQEDK